MTALPPFSNVSLDSRGRSIWPTLLEAECRAQSQATKYNDTLIAARVLGFLLLDLWEHQDVNPFGLIPYSHILSEIESSADTGVDAIYALGLAYRNSFMRLFRENDDSSSSYSPPSSETVANDTIDLIKQASQTNKEIKKVALFRDGNRCMLTGILDRMSIYRVPALSQRVEAEGLRTIFTQCAYIFPKPTHKEPGKTAFAILSIFGLGDMADQLVGDKVNSMQNVITISMCLRESFDTFNLWLDLVPGKINTYKICFRSELYAYDLHDAPREVNFSLDPEAVKACEAANAGPGSVKATLELPNPSLIAVRSTCARVAHMSGAANHAEETRRDEESVRVLATLGQDDGLSGSLLQSLIYQKIVYAV